MSDQFDIELWPDTFEAFVLFDRVRGQWNLGPAGPVSLNYQSVESALRMMGIPRRNWPDLFDDLQHIEAGALSEIYARSTTPT